MKKFVLIVLSLLVLNSGAFPQSVKDKKRKQTIKTVRLHIDGFQKSKSGAV